MNQYKFGNDFVPLTCYLKLESTIEDGCKEAKKMMDKLKKSAITGGGYTLLAFYTVFFSHFMMDYIFRVGGSKHSIVLSNVPAFQKPVYYGGKPAKRFYSLISASANLVTSISIISMPELC